MYHFVYASHPFNLSYFILCVCYYFSWIFVFVNFISSYVIFLFCQFFVFLLVFPFLMHTFLFGKSSGFTATQYVRNYFSFKTSIFVSLISPSFPLTNVCKELQHFPFFLRVRLFSVYFIIFSIGVPKYLTFVTCSTWSFCIVILIPRYIFS